ncbi:MAG: SMI1/KNR4 family protein [Verrucomicrobiota bacterium]|nr:SMI1/KNR4 family protein [Verrucomicrobiota bacterium]
MNSQIRDFFRVTGTQEPHFQEVRFLSEEKELCWDAIEPTGVPRGWFELSRISMQDRVEFTRDFWLTLLPFHPKATRSLEEFFERLDDVAVVICRQSKEEPWRAELIYSLADNSSFFRGLPPAPEEEIEGTMRELDAKLPRDYQAFFRVHNGFGKLTEMGLLPLEDIPFARQQLVNLVCHSEKMLRLGETQIDPASLYPFYEEYGVGGLQCFMAEWYPGAEMGNVYFSEIDYTLSDIRDRKGWAENLAYPTFLEWLTAFLEGMNGLP